MIIDTQGVFLNDLYHLRALAEAIYLHVPGYTKALTGFTAPRNVTDEPWPHDDAADLLIKWRLETAT